MDLSFADGLKIYYIRHGQSGHNVLKDWQDKPKAQWPAYVGNADAFSPLGEQEVAAVPGKLEKYHFDFIAASPTWRTRHTILPYLKKERLKAEIWPELEETKVAVWPVKGTPSPNIFFGGGPIKLSPDDKDYFTLRPEASAHCAGPSEGPQAERDAEARAQAAIALIKKRFGGTTKSILLVGHGNAGENFFRALTGARGDVFGIANTGVWMAEEQPDGHFEIKIANDRPVVSTAAAAGSAGADKE